MRRYLYILSILCLTACASNSENININRKVAGNDFIECVIGDCPRTQVTNSTRTTLSKTNIPFWASGDEISIIAEGSTNACFQIVSGAGTAKGTFRGGLPSANTFCAVYPYNESNSWSPGVLHFSKPQVQSCGADCFSGPSNVMVSTFTSAGLNPSFKNVFGLLQLNLAGNAQITKINLVSNNSTDMLYGDCSLAVNGQEGTDSQTLNIANGGNSVSLELSSPVRLSENTATSFYFVLPAGSLQEGFSITIYDTKDEAIFSKSTSNDQSISRSRILSMPVLYDINVDPAASAVPEPFTWAAYNDLQRTSSEATVIDPQTSGYPSKLDNKYVGIFYFVWHGQGGHFGQGSGPYDIHNLNGGSYGFIPAGAGYGANQDAHHWGKPYLDYYIMPDTWVIRKHAQMLVDAGVDFIALDVTNGQMYKNCADKICQTYRAMRDEGNKTPQITFMFAHNSEGNFGQLYYLYQNTSYSDLWFMLDGKPLLLADKSKMDVSYHGSFTFRHSWFIWNHNWQTAEDAGDPWWGKTLEEHKGKWPWGVCYTDNTTDPMVPGYDNNGNVEFCSVMPATHPTSNIGRSFQIGNGWQTTYSADSHNPGTVYPKYPAKGIYFKQQFAAAKNLDPKILFFVGWNEWVAQRNNDGVLNFACMCGVQSSGNSIFVDQYNHEFSRDIEPLSGDFGDNYYYYMADFIRQFKGVDRTPVYSKTRSINIDGDFTDWAGVSSCYADDKGDIASRNYSGWGSVGTLTNSSGRNDLKISRIATDGTNLYFYMEAATNLTNYNLGNNGLNLLIKSAGSSSWEGFNYIVEPTSANTATLSRCSGSGALVKETIASDIRIAVSGKCMEVAVPLSSIAISTPNSFSIDFKWVDNVDLTQGDGIQRCMRDGDSAPNGRFRYRYVFNK